MTNPIVKNNKENNENHDWLDKLKRKSDSSRTRIVARTSLKTFDLFCKSQGMERHPDFDVEFGLKLVSKNNMSQNWNLMHSRGWIRILEHFGFSGSEDYTNEGMFSIKISKQKPS